MKYDICCIGHITLDKVVTPQKTVYMPGGTAFYFARALQRLEHPSFLLVTALGKSEMKTVRDMSRDGIEVQAFPCENSVFFENIYGEDSNDRLQHVLSKAAPFTLESVKDVESRIYHLGSLLADDFSPEIIPGLASKGIVSVDVQGFMREVSGTEVRPCDWVDKIRLLPYISILKANEQEMLHLTGTSDPQEASGIIAGWGVKEVVLTLGDKGSVIYADGQLHSIPAYPVKDVVDATGCGDTYMAGYLYMRSQGKDIMQAGKFGAAMCSVKLAESGPFDATEKDVLELIRRFESGSGNP